MEDPSSQRSYKGKETVDLTDDNEQDAGPSFGVNGLGRTNSSIMDIGESFASLTDKPNYMCL